MHPDKRRSKIARRATLAVAATALLGVAASAQAGPPAAASGSAIVYRREVFRYSPAGRPDPFRSLLNATDVGVRLEDLSLRGVVYDPDPSHSVAVLARTGVDRPMRVRVGDRVGGIRVLAIRPRSIDVVVVELGVARRATLEIKKAPAKGNNS